MKLDRYTFPDGYILEELRRDYKNADAKGGTSLLAARSSNSLVARSSMGEEFGSICPTSGRTYAMRGAYCNYKRKNESCAGARAGAAGCPIGSGASSRSVAFRYFSYSRFTRRART